MTSISPEFGKSHLAEEEFEFLAETGLRAQGTWGWKVLGQGQINNLIELKHHYIRSYCIKFTWELNVVVMYSRPFITRHDIHGYMGVGDPEPGLPKFAHP